MKKAVIVVEGQTEQIFVLKFIERLITLQTHRIELKQLVGGGVEVKKGVRGPAIDHATHLIRIVNASNDDTVGSYINENIELYKSKGFDIVYGLRDQFQGNNNKKPLNVEKINVFYKELETLYGMKVEVIIAIEEIEAWFLCVPEFFKSLHHSLTLEKINEILDFNISDIPVESINHPTSTINKILSPVGLKYTKSINECHKIAELLNYESLYLEKSETIPSLKRLVDALDHVLS